MFNAEVERQRPAIDAQGGPHANPNSGLSDWARERQSIFRALEVLAYLTYTRKRISPTDSKAKSGKH
jgi:hypothetical protein